MSGELSGETAPQPHGVDSVDELVARLRALQLWSGVAYRELHRRVVRGRRRRGIAELPSYNTVYRCLQPGRSRLDVELVVDIVRAALPDDAGAEQWRQACQMLATRQSDAAVVSVTDRLPDDPPGFTGRDKELGQLFNEITTAPDGAVVIFAIKGMAGVGKTRLALHAAHTLVRHGRCTDLRLWVDLRGYDPQRPPADPAAVLDGFLRRLGVPGGQIAGMDLAGRSARFRELVAGTRTLVVLDNAASVDQVAPLLPAAATTLTLVTSRKHLIGLDEAHSGTGRAHVSTLPLDVYTPADALDALRTDIGADRVAEDRSAAARIGGLVGHLPLALSLVAARIRTMPDWSLADHADRLAERRAELRLDSAVAVALQLSYDELPDEHQRLLRFVSLHPGRDLDANAATALADVDLAGAHRLLADLLRRSLLLQRAPNRYELHDLVRDFATDRAKDTDPPRVRHAALDRLFDYYRYAALRATHVYAPQDRPRAPEVADPGHTVPTFATRQDAAAWLDTERANLLATTMPTDHHDDRADHVSDLAIILFRYLDVSGHHRDNEYLQALACRVSHGATRARALNQLGIVYLAIGRYLDAVDRFQQALDGYRAADDVGGQSGALTNLGGVRYQLGDYRGAKEYFTEAADLAHRHGDLVGEGRDLDNLGNTLLQLGRYPDATEVLHRARDVVHAAADHIVEGHVLANLGEVHHRTGQPETALEYLAQGLVASQRAGHRLGIADTLNRIGIVKTGQNEHQTALGHHREALTIAREDGHRELETESLNALGAALRRAGDIAGSADCHRQALALADELGMRHQQAHAHDGLANAALATADQAGARRHWHTAYRLYTDLGVPEAQQAERRLDELGTG